MSSISLPLSKKTFLPILCFYCVLAFPIKLMAHTINPIVMPSCLPVPHDYYVSVCQIDHQVKQKSLAITFKIFTDDLEIALTEYGADNLHIGTDKEDAETDVFLFKYLQQQFALQADDEVLALQFVGKEVELDVTWCYIEVVNLPADGIQKLHISNRILTNTYDKQMNMVHVKYGQKEQSLLLHKNYYQDTLYLEE